MNNPFDYIPDEACTQAFRRLLHWLEALKGSQAPEIAAFCRELEDGKMLGVLIAVDASGMHHTLYAFSGQLGDAGFRLPDFIDTAGMKPSGLEDEPWRPEFVGPVFDYLRPDGYFKRLETEISRMNAEISRLEEGEYARVKCDYEKSKAWLEEEISQYREKCRQSKLEREAKRNSGLADDAERAAMIRQSQFEKAELRRMKKRMEANLQPSLNVLEEMSRRLDAMKEHRRCDSEALQQWLFSSFTVLNARGERRSLSDIFASTSLKVPPSGAGECCAPKLLQAAYLRGWQPLAMAEYWYGRPKGGEVRVHGCHYPACRGKCLPVLTWMLQGLNVEPPLESGGSCNAPHEPEVIFENEWFCVVDKPSGMLSVPGKGEVVSVQEWLAGRYGPERPVKMAHRLDQDTSGLLVATFGDLPFKVMQSLFARREVAKTYVAELEGDYVSLGLPRCGRIELPLSPDWFDRPRQRVDFKNGKEAVTDYEFTRVFDGRSRVTFHPHTGRTHQLRVHAASAHGLGMPIAGDRLYATVTTAGPSSSGTSPTAPGRLLLHAHRLEFTFPLDGRRYSFEALLSF